MKIISFFLKKQFEVKFKDKLHYISYINSTSDTLCLLNRNNWEIYEEDGDELFEFVFKRDKFVLDKNRRDLKIKLIKYCIKNFNNYKPNYNTFV